MSDDQKCEGCDKCRAPYRGLDGYPDRCDSCGRFTEHRWFLGDPDDAHSWQDYWRCSQEDSHTPSKGEPELWQH